MADFSAALRPLLTHPVSLALRRVAGRRPVYLVGGILRDTLLRRETRDVDAVVAEGGEEVARRLARILPARLVVLGGERFAAWRLVGEDFTLDLWDREGSSLAADLARRDFTVNALALDLATGEGIDLFGGVADLEHRLLRATTPESFTGDPLRVLRLVRLAVTLGFEAEEETLRQARQATGELTRVAAERIREELGKIFAAEAGSRPMELLGAVGLYPSLWRGRPGREAPEGEAADDPAALSRALDGLSSLAAVDREHGPALKAMPGRLDRALARWVVSLLALDGPPPAAARSEAEEALDRFREAVYLTRQETKAAAALFRLGAPPRGEIPRRRFLHRAGELAPTAVLLAAARCQAEGEPDWLRTELPALIELAAREGRDLLDPPHLLSGEEAQTLLGLPPGPDLGRALNALRGAQVDGVVRTREEARRWLSEHP